MLTDSHCHLDRLDLNPYQGDLTAALDAARKLGVHQFLCVGIDLDHFPQLVEIAESESGVLISVGLHPTEECAQEPSVDELVKLGSHLKVVAIGETGLDFYREHNRDLQQSRFEIHIQAAHRLKKPLIVHSRQAKAETLAFLKSAESVGGVLHCFTEDLDMAMKAIDLNFYISFSGIVTFHNASTLKEVARKIPLDRMLLETDSPYLAPVPHRGKPNEPAYVRYVAEYIAQLRGVTFFEIAQQTTENFNRLFYSNKIN